jgi:hypothetical protein
VNGLIGVKVGSGLTVTIGAPIGVKVFMGTIGAPMGVKVGNGLTEAIGAPMGVKVLMGVTETGAI